ncbi:MAG: T9SS type B sorting domain-containing protein, partial [Flavobacterium sp.]
GETGYTLTNYFADNQVLTIDVAGFGNYTYQLDNGAPQTSNVFYNVSSAAHTVTITDANVNSCGAITIIDVRTVDYPKFFTPNGDGYHDTWNITGLGDEGTATSVSIFDRFGKLVKQISTSNESDGWDGTMNGRPLPADDYWFTIEYREGDVTKEFKSHFALKR